MSETPNLATPQGTQQSPQQPPQPAATPGAAPAASPTPPLPPSAMRFHPQPPPVTRLSRRVLAGLGAVAAVAICAALGFALWPHGQQAPTQSVATSANTLPEALTDMLKEHSEEAQAAHPLGAPMPGDLGRPMLEAGVPPPTIQAPETSEQQRIAQEQEAARTSRLFVANAVAQAAPPPGPAPAPPSAPNLSQISSDPTATQNMQDEKRAFANQASDTETVSPARIEKPASPYIIQAGWIISGALSKGIESDLPGDVRAQVTQNVYDSPTGRYLLIPQGSTLFGKYSSQVSFGQTRVQMIWTRLIFPNGDSIQLQHLPGEDAQGYAGLEDEVDEHWGSLFEAALLSTILSVGAEAGTSDSENNLAQAIRQGASQSFNQAGEQIVSRNLNIQPTLTERFGVPVTITVDHDLVLKPYVQDARE